MNVISVSPASQNAVSAPRRRCPAFPKVPIVVVIALILALVLTITKFPVQGR